MILRPVWRAKSLLMLSLQLKVDYPILLTVWKKGLRVKVSHLCKNLKVPRITLTARGPIKLPSQCSRTTSTKTFTLTNCCSRDRLNIRPFQRWPTPPVFTTRDSLTLLAGRRVEPETVTLITSPRPTCSWQAPCQSILRLNILSVMVWTNTKQPGINDTKLFWHNWYQCSFWCMIWSNLMMFVNNLSLVCFDLFKQTLQFPLEIMW